MDEDFVDTLERELGKMRPNAPSPEVSLRVTGRILRRQAKFEMLRSFATLSIVAVLATAGGRVLCRENLDFTFRNGAMAPPVQLNIEIASDSEGAYMAAMRCSTRTFEQLLHRNRVAAPGHSTFPNAPWWRIIKEPTQ